MNNVCFLRTRIEWIDSFFAPEEVDEIWIPFPDPHIKSQRTKHRLTHSRFLRLYARVLRTGGLLHLKTDNGILYGYTMGVMESHRDFETLYSHHDVYSAYLPPNDLCASIQTYYEKKFLPESQGIKYALFKKKNIEVE